MTTLKIGCMILTTALGILTMRCRADDLRDPVVVVGSGAESAVKIAADEFAKYWREVTDRALVIAEPPMSGRSVVIGVDAARPWGANDAYLLRDEGDTLRLVGKNGRSVLYAVYEFFRLRAGCNWFWDGDVVPKAATIDWKGLDVREESRFEYRGLRYFAHRGLTRFQAEHWGLDDWKREIDWMVKNRFNVFMLRIGQDDLFQRAFPDVVPYPQPGAPNDNGLKGYDARAPFWTLQYRGELRKKILAYAFARGLMHPEDFGTMTHWYSRTPQAFLDKMKPDLLKQQCVNYSEESGLVWDVRKDKWRDAYWKLTETSVREYGRPDLLHTIGLGERMIFTNRADNLKMKIDVLKRMTDKAVAAYPDSKILLADWDFYSTWTSDEVKTLLRTLDPKRTVVWDYVSDTADSYYYSGFPLEEWDVIGKFPYVFGLFVCYEQALDIRANYKFIEERWDKVKDDPFCKGWVFWPESSHTDIFFLRYFTDNAWRPDGLNENERLLRFCRARYGKDAQTMAEAWAKTLLLSQTIGWWGNYGQNMINWEQTLADGNDLDITLLKARTAREALSLLAKVDLDNPFVRRDAVDLARTILDRSLNAGRIRLWKRFADWRERKVPTARLLREIDAFERLGADMLALLGQHTDYSLYDSLERLKAVSPVANEQFDLTLLQNAANKYCRSHQYEVAAGWYQPLIRGLCESLRVKVRAGDRTEEDAKKRADLCDGLGEKLLKTRLAALRPTTPRTAENLRRVLTDAHETLPLVVAPAKGDADLTVVYHGSSRNSGEDETAAIQRAIDDAWKKGGGRVDVPPGVHYVKGLRLRSNVELHLQTNAVLMSHGEVATDFDVLQHDRLEPLPSARLEAARLCGWRILQDRNLGYVHPICEPASHWCNAMIRLYGATNAAITGEKGSAIDGANSCEPDIGEQFLRGVHGITAHFTTNFVLRGVQLRRMGNWATCFHDSADLVFENLVIRDGYDGVHVRGCDRVRVAHCDIRTGDDCVAGFDNSDVTVEDCYLTTPANGFRFGGTHVRIRRCTMKGPAESPIRSKLPQRIILDRADYEGTNRPPAGPFFAFLSDVTRTVRQEPGDIVIEDCTIDTVERLFFYDLQQKHPWQIGSAIRDITFRNIKATNLRQPSRPLTTKDHPLDMRLDNVTQTFVETADVVIVGSTPAGISAAVQLTRMGRKVILLSPTDRIGGMSTSGLGRTDVGQPDAFGGLARDFYRGVSAYAIGEWSDRAQWCFTPSAALRLLEIMEKKEKLDIRRGERLDRGKVKVRGEGEQRRIVALVSESGKQYEAKMFIDATYEGDLMAAVGVTYVIGREGNETYGETLNGAQPGRGHHRLASGIDPYVVKGDPKSGLLPGVESEPLGAVGTGDRRLQAYCYRLCLTDVESNRVPFVKPKDYDEREYEILFRHYECGAPTNEVPFSLGPLSEWKCDANNTGGVSFDWIGHSVRWPEASYAERDQIAAGHKRYQQGLLWTLANHPRVPKGVRDAVSRWGLAKDEFIDSDHWPRQIYVREARRLSGEYVMTEHNCRGTRRAPHPIACGAYQMDSHHCRRCIGADGFVLNEGDVQEGQNGALEPYGIDYGAIVPKRGECANLLVPVCLSASHIAYGSIRMEPVFFALGQAAGTAAALSLEAGCAVQDLDYAILRKRLLADGQVLEAETTSRSYVDPFIGTSANGHTTPAATVPFGMVQAGPDTGNFDWHHCSGYRHEETNLFGFTQTHLSGTGGIDLGDFRLLPFQGGAAPESVNIEKATERAEPGFYAVTAGGVATEIAATRCGAVYTFRFPSDGVPQLLFDNVWTLHNPVATFGELIEKARFTPWSDRRGWTAYHRVNGWAKGRDVFCAVSLSEPWTMVEELPRIAGEKAGRYVLTFPSGTRTLELRIALSRTDEAAALRNLAAELPNTRTVADVRRAASSAWEAVLSRVKATGTRDELVNLYTALYHICFQPNDISDDGEKPYYSTFSLWDTFRAAHPLYTELVPERVPGMVDSMLADAKKNGYLPVWTLWGAETQCMIGTHSVPVVVDAYLKGLIPNVDTNALMQTIHRTLCWELGRRKDGWPIQRRFGYYPQDLVEHESVSRTLECAYDDACAARFAAAIGDKGEERFFGKLAETWRNVFDAKTRFMRPKNTDGKFVEPFSPFRQGYGSGYTEGNAWQYTWHVLHDVEGLIVAMGGKEQFLEKLDELFRQPEKVDGMTEVADATGLIGQYAHGNEPSHHVPFLFALAGAPERTDACVRAICTKFYHPTPDGLCGNDDCGQMSAWYVYACLGRYPVDPCGGRFVTFTPMMKNCRINR